MVDLSETPIDHQTVTESVRSPRAGGACTFLGTVREWTDGRETSSLEYEAYREMALERMADLERRARERWPIVGAALVHRVGMLGPGEVAVVVAVSTPHRAEAFEACRWLIDAIKDEVPIWKREVGPDGSTEWVDPTNPGRPGPPFG